MSQILINAYLNDLERYKKFSGSATEGIISEAFKDLLKAWARASKPAFHQPVRIPVDAEEPQSDLRYHLAGFKESNTN